MADHRIHVPSLQAQASLGVSLLEIDGPEAEHALRVKRLRVGESVVIFDGQGAWMDGVVAGPDGAASESGGPTGAEAVVGADRTGGRRGGKKAASSGRSRREGSLLRVQATGTLQLEPTPRPRIVIAAAIAKGARPDDMIDLLSQVGADGWIPLRTARSVVVDPREGRFDKWSRRAVEAAKQCGRPHLLEIHPVADVAALIGAAAAAGTGADAGPGDGTTTPIARRRHLVVAEATGSVTLPASLLDPAQTDEVVVAIGPEGGFTPEEMTALRRSGNAFPLRLGPYIMRVETAAVAAAALLATARTAFGHAMAGCVGGASDQDG